MNKSLGLFRLIPYQEQEQIVSELSVFYADVYDALEETRENVRELERGLDQLFYGDGYGKPIDEVARNRKRTS
ncbi:MAG: hypothetical protein Q8Q36_02295 [bacterium]|nr:hypothetical protein [bacterium]